MRKKRYYKCYKCGRISKLFRCKYCGNYFCIFCNESKMPLTPSMVFNEKNPILKQLYEEEWRKGGHACVTYGKQKLNEIKGRETELTEKTIEALDKMKEVPLKRPSTFEKFKPIKIPWRKRSRPLWFEQVKRPSRLKSIFKVIIFTLIALFLVIFLVDKFRSYIQSAGSELQKVGYEISGKPEINISELEKEIHNLVNIERTNNGFSQLQWDDKLADIARKHSQDMANRDFFSHINPEGQDPTARGNIVGYSCYKSYGGYYRIGLAENLFQNNLYDSVTYVNGILIYSWNTRSEIASSTVSGWMSSFGHRQNILTSTYDREGIGITIYSNDKVYITQVFC